MAAFYNLARFRVPCIPLMSVLAGCGVIFFIKGIKNGKNRRQKILLSAFALLCAWFIPYQGFDYYRANIEPAMMRMIRPAGVQVPNRAGGVLFYDNGPQFHGGWQPVRTSRLFKRFVPEKQIPAGEKVRISLALVCGPGTPVLGINGAFLDLSGLRRGKPKLVTQFHC